MYPSKITVTKGRTTERNKKWSKLEYTIEMVLSEKDNPEECREYASILLDAWLKEGEK